MSMSMTSTEPIPVTLLTGFLGSGKTTLLNRLLRHVPLTAVVMNEFGDVGLDHRLLEETRGPLALLSGGCVCCQIQGALAPTLKNLWMGRQAGRVPDARGWLAHSRYRPARGGQAPGAGEPHLGRIRAFSVDFDQPLDWLGVQSALEMLVGFRGRNLLRMKAILDIEGRDRPVVLHGVQHVLYPPTELPAWPDEDRRSRFVFITADLDEGFVARLLEDFTQAAAAGVFTQQTGQEAA